MDVNKKSINALTEYEAKQFLQKYGVPVVEEKIASNPDEAVKISQDMGFPVVLKGLGKKLTHKTELGIVFLNLTDAKQVEESAKAIIQKAGKDLEGILVQPYISGKREFTAGLLRDEHFGPVIMFGLGGIFTEALGDTIFMLAPIDEQEALTMIKSIKSKALLKNFRNEAQVDQKALINTLLGLSDISQKHPEISEIDINPLLATSQGKIWAVDALIIKKEKEEKYFSAPISHKKLKNFLTPKSVAIVGAASKLMKWGHMLLTNVISGGFKGSVVFVNKHGGYIAEQKVYESVEDIQEHVDLAVVTVPVSAVKDVIAGLNKKNIPNMLLITSGWGEMGEQGKQLEQDVVKMSYDNNILMIGPNTMGMANPHIHFYCTGLHVRPKPGGMAVISQSGNVGHQVLALAEKYEIGVRCFIGTGNEAMVTVEDLFEGFGQDQGTNLILLYVESLKNSQRFFKKAKQITLKKPVIILKGGQTEAGNRAAASHTGALSSNSAIFNAACRQSGIIKVDSMQELLDISMGFSSLPLPQGNRIAILTLGGGLGVITSDLCIKYGLKVPELSEKIIKHIDLLLPPFWSKTNPVDIVGQFDNSLPVVLLEEILKWEGCDAVIEVGILGRRFLIDQLAESAVVSDPSYPKQELAQISKEFHDFESKFIDLSVTLMEKYKKPIIGVPIYDEAANHVFKVKDSKFKGLFFPTPERAVKVLSRMYEYKAFLDK